MPPPFRKIALLGAGSFGTAVAHHIASLPAGRCDEVVLFGRDEEVVTAIDRRHENPKYLAGVGLSDALMATTSLEEALSEAELVFLAVPAQHLTELLPSIADHIKDGAGVVDLAKGIEREGLKRLSTLIDRSLNKAPRGSGGPVGSQRPSGSPGHDAGQGTPVCKQSARHPLASLSGPSFARDLVAGHPVGLTLGSRDRRLLQRVQALLTTPEFDVKTTTDLAGVELGGALKNVFALAAGVLSVTQSGDSLAGDYFTRAMVELREVGLFMGGRWATFSGRSGLGDLVVTCSPSSRNFRFGATYARLFTELQSGGLSEEAGAGLPGTRNLARQAPANSSPIHERVFAQAILELGTRTIEGYDTLAAVQALAARRRLFTPLIFSLHQLFHRHTITPAQLLPTLRNLDLRRRKEGPRFYSMLLHQLLPRVYYRRF